MSTILPFAAAAEPELEPDDLQIEPDEPGVEPEPDDVPIDDVPREVRDEPVAPSEQIARVPLVELLPADFRIPILTKFCPNPELRRKADEAGTYALALKVDGVEGLQTADVALAAVRASLKAIVDTFEEPCAIANALHKRLTAMRGEWCERGEQAIKLVGGRIYTEQKRLEAIAAEDRRKAQAEADQQAREEAARQAKAAEAAQAPAAVVETLKEQAKTATAPPVATTSYAPPALKGNTTVAKWRARFKGTPGSEESNPSIDALTAAQQLEAFHLVAGVAAQLARDLKLTLEPDYLARCAPAPINAIDLNWPYLNRRAAADKKTFAVPGLEAVDEGGIRGKSTRSR